MIPDEEDTAEARIENAVNVVIGGFLLCVVVVLVFVLWLMGVPFLQ